MLLARGPDGDFNVLKQSSREFHKPSDREATNYPKEKVTTGFAFRNWLYPAPREGMGTGPEGRRFIATQLRQPELQLRAISVQRRSN
jgi:hypothetical protein